MVMLLQSSMDELVNVSWVVVLVKSIGAAECIEEEKGSRELYTQMLEATSTR